MKTFSAILFSASISLLVSCAGSAAPGSGNAASKSSVALEAPIPQTNFAEVNADLDSFRTSKDPDILMKAGVFIQGIDDSNGKPQVDPKIRVGKIRAYLMLLRTLNASMDPMYPDAPEYRASLHAPMPPDVAQALSKQGLIFGQAVEPNVITDPKLRQEYLDAIAENQKKMENSEREKKLRFSEEIEEGILINYISKAYPGESNAKEEVAQLAKDSGASPNLQKKMVETIQ
jgi:hypothetical protein